MRSSRATKLGLNDAAKILGETLQEEKATDAALTKLAKSEINIEADDQREEHEGEMKPKKRVSSK
ncbi:DUF892 family protein [Hyphomicrobium facile]|uniref:DUF892 family protein n=1 Tax=Hyphomicrobium facile TaxID=51670 RepID=UPI001FCD15EC|nr:DUF892 family protein [Hyphomicrobium facile]